MSQNAADYFNQFTALLPFGPAWNVEESLVSQMTSQGGQTVAYLVRLAEAAGFPITISMFSPFTVKSTVNSHLLGASWAYAFQVNAPYAAETAFTVAGGVNEALNSWGNAALEALINRYKPAHTVPIFSY